MKILHMNILIVIAKATSMKMMATEISIILMKATMSQKSYLCQGYYIILSLLYLMISYYILQYLLNIIIALLLIQYF